MASVGARMLWTGNVASRQPLITARNMLSRNPFRPPSLPVLIRHLNTSRSYSSSTVFSAPRILARPKTTSFILQSSRSLRFPIFRRLFSRSRSRRAEPSPNPTANLNSPKPENLSLSQRLRKLSREYGWSAVGVYLLLSALDFPFCYLLVRTLGTDRIGEWEEIIVSNISRVIPESAKTAWHDWRSSMHQAERDMHGSDTVSEGVEMAGWGVEEADKAHKRDASLATQLALAYAIHKSFIFIRVPLTAAVTPKVVQVLRGWGWDIGKRTTKAAKAANRAGTSSS